MNKRKEDMKVDNMAFDMMTAVNDKTDVNIIPPQKKEISTKNIHRALMAAGMSPAYGNIADAADAVLYAFEGEFGEAALSLGAMLPFIGQFVAAKRASKIVKRIPTENKLYQKDFYDSSDIVKSLDVDGKSVGYIRGKKTSKGIRVESIQVDEKYRRFGFGTDLYKSLMEETSGRVYSRGWSQNPKTAAKVWEHLVKKGEAEMIPSGAEPIYYLIK